MELRTAASPRDVKHYTTQRLREEFLIQKVFVPDEIKLVYSGQKIRMPDCLFFPTHVIPHP